MLPRCFPSLNNPVPHLMERPLHPDSPNLNDVLSSQLSLRTHIPKAAEEPWARCLLPGLSGVIISHGLQKQIGSKNTDLDDFS